jgi:hypothetical protein
LSEGNRAKHGKREAKSRREPDREHHRKPK